MDSPGRSGSKFFLSYDKKVVVKSITSEEVALLHQILQPYHEVGCTPHGMAIRVRAEA
jgi:1-phosphatidylinositol-5-phosphate 4-kinase